LGEKKAGGESQRSTTSKRVWRTNGGIVEKKKGMNDERVPSLGSR